MKSGVDLSAVRWFHKPYAPGHCPADKISGSSRMSGRRPCVSSTSHVALS